MGIFDSIGGLFSNSASKKTGKYATYGYDNPKIQGFLPNALQSPYTNPILSQYVKNLGDLTRNPGSLSPTVSSAIAPRLANESQSIATNFRNMGANAAGAASRYNLPVSIKAALENAMNTNQERAQREARNTAMFDSEQLRRGDIRSIEPLLNALLQFTSTGRGQAIQALGGAASGENNSESSTLATLASLAGLAGMFMSNSRFKEDIEPADEAKILDAIKSIQVYSWKYKGDDIKHVGPLAEDFRDAFGLGDGADTIHVIDAIGTLMAATRALADKVERIEKAA